MNYRQLSISVLILVNAIAFWIFRGYGVLTTGLFSFFSVPVWSDFYMNFNKVTSESLKSDWHSFINEGGMRLILPMAFHVVIWIKIGWSTLYPHLFKAYAISVFLGFAIALLKKKMKNHIYVISLSLAPLIVSLMLIVNYSFSSNPYDETFSYVAPTNQRINSFDQDRFIMTPRIILKDHAYGEYQGMRSFLSKEEFKGNKITYSFEIGLFGIPVVKDWEFHK